MIPEFLKVTLKRIAWLMLAYTLARLIFLVWNWPIFSDEPVTSLLLSFVYGLRFDLSVLLFTNAALLLLWLLPAQWTSKPWFAKVDRTLFALINFFFVGLNFIDIEYNRYIGKRLSFEYFFLQADIQRQSAGLLLTYWPLLTMISIITMVLVWRYPKFSPNAPRETWAKGLVWRCGFIALVVLGMRGGFGFKPLHPMDAYFVPSQDIGLLTLNTPFNVIKTRRQGVIVTERLVDNYDEAIARVKKLTTPSRPPLGLLKDFNVMIILIESFATEDVGAANSYPGYTPFFDELAKEGHFFKYNLANSRRSIDGVTAVFCGIPAMSGEAIVMSEFIHNRLDCLPELLGQSGYDSHLLHGAHNGSMHFDKFSTIAGFKHFVGYNEFPNKRREDIDPAWGIVDESMLLHAATIFDKATQPTFVGLFTLSSHHPYFIPEHLRGKFPKGENEIHESIGYTDYSLRRFFEVAKTKPWFNKTIFVFTGDHVHPTNRPEYLNLLGVWRVPLLIYSPGLRDRVKVSPDRITQHIDILPSVLDLLGITRSEPFLLGQSVFDPGNEGRAYNYVTTGYWHVDSEKLVQYNRFDKSAQVFKHDKTWNPSEEKVPTESIRELPQLTNLLSIAEYFNQGLIGNAFYTYDAPKTTAR